MLIAIEKVIEDECVDAFGISVDPDAGIKICGAALNNHHQRVGVGRLGAGKKRQHESAND
jgi:hypothetical protein